MQFLSDEYDDLAACRKKIWNQIKRLSSKLDTICTQVDRISQAIDSFEMYSYQYNIKIVGIPQVAETVSEAVSRRQNLNLFEAILMHWSRHHIAEYRHRTPGSGNNVVAADLDLTLGSIHHFSIYDHLIPRLQDLLYEAKRSKTANNYKYCLTKNSAMFTYDKMIRRKLLSLRGSAISPLCYQTMRPQIWRSNL